MLVTAQNERNGTDHEWAGPSPSGGPCATCREPITDEHSYWVWSLGTMDLFMHEACFVDWFPRPMLDYSKARHAERLRGEQGD